MVFDDLIYLLERGGLGLTYSTNLFKGPKAIMPTGNGPYVSLIKAGGFGAEGTHNSPDVPAYERPTVQIVTRATDYDITDAKSAEIYALMYRTKNQFVNGTWWRSMKPRAEAFDLPADEKGRVRIAFYIECVKRTSPATS